MKSIYVTLWVEWLKIRKSRVFWLSLLFFVLVSMMMGLVVTIQEHPEIAQKLGLLGTKASLMKFGEPNWKNYLAFLLQGISAVGLIGYGFITSWIFGREYSDKTLKDILALPVKRSSIVVSKMIVSIIWSILITCAYLISSLLFGVIAGIKGGESEIIIAFIRNFSLVCLLTLLLNTPIAFLASCSKGILLPIGFVILTMMMANFTGLLGAGPYFPWAMPGILTIPAGSDGIHLTAASYIILGVTSLAGLLGTLAWWKYADHK
jgi:ABC-2 type transport system permease protein